MTNKILLAAIALGLWANAAVNYVRPARADVEGVLSGIAYDVHAPATGNAGCRNSKIYD